MSDTADVGAEMVALQRAARLADITPEQWAQRVRSLMLAQGDIADDIDIRNVRPVETAAGGSNGTLLFEASYTDGNGRQDGAFVLRFLPVAGYFHRYSVAEQFNLQRALQSTNVPVAEQMWLDEDGKWLERPGYVMRRSVGTSTPLAWRTSGIVHDATPEARREMSLSYIHAQADIHNVDWRGLGLQWLENRAAGTRPIERETNWYWDSILFSGQDEFIKALEPIKDWLIANEPADQEIVLCHGDNNFGNYLFQDNKVTTVLDWEMAFLGTPECDLLFTRTGDLILHPDDAWPEGFLTYAEMEDEYGRITGRTLKHLEYYELFTALRVATTGILTIRHYPPELLDKFRPIIMRGPEICLARARALNII